MIKRLLFIILACLCLTGCAQVPLEITKYTPQNKKESSATSFIKGFESYEIFNNQDITIDSNIYGFNDIIVLLIAVKNNTGKNIEPKDYSLSLVDGRDHKTIKMLSRDDLAAIKAKLGGGSSNRPLQDQVIETTVNNAMNAVNMPTKDKLVDLISIAVDNYFSFRPIYAGEARQGVLCFMPNFSLEYPLVLLLKINQHDLDFQFVPKPK